MAENLLHRSRRATAEGLMDAEESKRGLGQLPFDLTAELGSVIEAEEISPGVYSILTDQKEWGPEYYVVMKDAPAISRIQAGATRERPLAGRSRGCLHSV